MSAALVQETHHPSGRCRPDAPGSRMPSRWRASCVSPAAVVRQVVALTASELPRVGRQIELLHAAPTGMPVDGQRTREPPLNAASLWLRRLQANVVLPQIASFGKATYDAHGRNVAPGVEFVMQVQMGRAGDGTVPPPAQAHESPAEDSVAPPPGGVDHAALFRSEARDVWRRLKLVYALLMPPAG